MVLVVVVVVAAAVVVFGGVFGVVGNAGEHLVEGQFQAHCLHDTVEVCLALGPISTYNFRVGTWVK
jgi:hypothetical protein